MLPLPHSRRPDVARAFDHLVALFDMAGLSSPAEIVATSRDRMERYGDCAPRAPLGEVTVKPVRIGSLEAEWLFVPGARMENRILYLHGGGMMAGSPASHRPLAAELARQSGYAVLLPAYRLAPEHVFPAAHDDCAAAYDWLTRHGPDGAHPARHLFVAGDSAGGNLAAALCAGIIAQGGVMPAALALFCPCLDNRDHPGRAPRPDDPLINNAVVGAIALYAAATPREHPRISALLTPDAVLAHFPPTLVQIGAGEYLLDDAQSFTARLTALERRNLLSVWPGMPHVWHAFQTALPEAKAAMAEAAVFLTAATER